MWLRGHTQTTSSALPTQMHKHVLHRQPPTKAIKACMLLPCKEGRAHLVWPVEPNTGTPCHMAHVRLRQMLLRAPSLPQTAAARHSTCSLCCLQPRGMHLETLYGRTFACGCHSRRMMASVCERSEQTVWFGPFIARVSHTLMLPSWAPAPPAAVARALQVVQVAAQRACAYGRPLSRPLSQLALQASARHTLPQATGARCGSYCDNTPTVTTLPDSHRRGTHRDTRQARVRCPPPPLPPPWVERARAHAPVATQCSARGDQSTHWMSLAPCASAMRSTGAAPCKHAASRQNGRCAPRHCAWHGVPACRASKHALACVKQRAHAACVDHACVAHACVAHACVAHACVDHTCRMRGPCRATSGSGAGGRKPLLRFCNAHPSLAHC